MKALGNLGINLCRDGLGPSRAESYHCVEKCELYLLVVIEPVTVLSRVNTFRVECQEAGQRERVGWVTLMIGRPVRSLCDGVGLVAFSPHLPETPAVVLLVVPFLVLPVEMHILLKCQGTLWKKSLDVKGSQA